MWSPSDTDVDWSQCRLVHRKPGILGGTPVLIGTRMPAGTIVSNYDYGMSELEISVAWELPLDTVMQIVKYAEGHRIESPVR